MDETTFKLGCNIHILNIKLVVEPSLYARFHVEPLLVDVQLTEEQPFEVGAGRPDLRASCS